MWSDSSESRNLVRDYTKQLVTELAPEELPMFDELVNEYYSDPAPPDLTPKPNDDLLGFGTPEALVAVTPAAIAAVIASLNYIFTELLKITEDEAANALKRRIQVLFNEGKKLKNKVSPLTNEQLNIVKSLAVKEAIVFGIKPDQAKLFGNALIGILALRKYR